MTTTTRAVIIAGIIVAVIAGVPFTGAATTSALELTGHQLFANGTGRAYFDDGTAQSFKHIITAAAGYYYDNSTIFYTGEIPGIPQSEGILCGSKVNDTRVEYVHITLIRGADLIQNKSKAIEPGPVVRINVGDTVTWVNKDYVAHTITSPPGPGVPPYNDLPSGTNFEGAMSENESFRCTFTEPGGFHYGIGFNSEIKGAIIVEER